MARIIVGSYAIRFPLGGYLSWVLQWLLGFQMLGHDVYFVEKSGWANSCYDPWLDVMTDDCSRGIAAFSPLLGGLGMEKKWCFVDSAGGYRGLTRNEIESVFKTADLFVDMGTHGAWLPEAQECGLSVLVDGDPGQTQLTASLEGTRLPEYDHYYTVGRNLGTSRCPVPTLGRQWRPIYDPVVVGLFPCVQNKANASFTTMMVWQSYAPVEFEGVKYGMKDIEFSKFIDLPRIANSPLEITLGGCNAPEDELMKAGWRLAIPREVTATFDSYRRYIADSRGEFSVNKNVYVATNSGFFSERSAAYLASGRPVVMQDTGFSEHLPCGAGLFAVDNVEEAAEAIQAVNCDYARQSKCAREIALEYLDTRVVLGRFLEEVGVS